MKAGFTLLLLAKSPILITSLRTPSRTQLRRRRRVSRLSSTMASAAPQIVPWGSPLPKGPQTVSVFSYNCLLPNSQDGWWLYKMYSPLGAPVTETETAWPHRATLLKQQIEAADADIVCIQECAEKSFETDFAFMAELGYTERELFRKGRFRPATFWRPDRVELLATPAHKDRILVTPFSPVHRVAAPAPTVWVLNCHLTAGPEGPRRLRQMQDGLDYVRKDLVKRGDAARKAAADMAKANKAAVKQQQQKEKQQEQPANEGGAASAPVLTASASAMGSDATPTPATKTRDVALISSSPPPPGDCVIVVGDMNAEGARPSGVAALLAHGVCEPSLLEDGVPVTAKTKAQTLAKFIDPYELAFEGQPPPTMVCENLIPRLLAKGEEEHGSPHPNFLVALRGAFEAFATAQGEEEGGTLRGVPLVVRPLSSSNEFWNEALPLRHRVLWPEGALNEALVPGESPEKPSNSVGASAGVSADEGSTDEISSGGDRNSAAVHLGLYEGFADSLAGVLSLYLDTHPGATASNEIGDQSVPSSTRTTSSGSDGGEATVRRVRLRKFAVEPWVQRRGYGSKLLEQAKVAAVAMVEADAAALIKTPGGESDTGASVVLWCDARAEQTSFYAERGFTQAGETFMKKGRPYVVMECALSSTGKSAEGATKEIIDGTSLLVNKPLASGTVVGETEVPVMNKAAVCQWLNIINFQVGRGSEFRSAAECMGWVPPPSPPRGPPEEPGSNGNSAHGGSAEVKDARPPRPTTVDDLPEGGVLTWRDFRRVYEAEVRGGKYWGVAWDLSKCGSPLPGANLDERFTARYDRVWVGETAPVAAASGGGAGAANSGVGGKKKRGGGSATEREQAPSTSVNARVVAVRATMAESSGPPPLLPNAQHPSDHLPIGLTVDFAQ